jgi:hypothetical protein
LVEIEEEAAGPAIDCKGYNGVLGRKGVGVTVWVRGGVAAKAGRRGEEERFVGGVSKSIPGSVYRFF